MSVQITLVGYGHTVTMDKSRLISMFPQSLFAGILEQDQGATEIPISVPFVTPSRNHG